MTVVLVLVFSRPAWAQNENPDLARIPASAAPPGVTTASSTGDAFYLQSYLALTALRDDLAVPLPPPEPARWEARLFLDARIDRSLTSDLDFLYSGRLNIDARDGVAFGAHQDIRNDLREAYLAWRGGSDLFVELGRINLKSGVGLGFNPTDFFKTRSVVDPVSPDPTTLREDRLGAVMLQVQKIWTGGSLTIAFAPRLAAKTAPYMANNLPSFNPMFDRTNADSRVLIKASVHLFGMDPEFLAYHEAGRTHVGINLTQGFGQAVVGYVEWAADQRASLVYESYADGVRTGVLPVNSPIQVSDRRSFDNDLAIGASYATELGITVDLEYDYHQAGFSDADWRHWFDTGMPNKANHPLLGELWFLRGYAGDQLEPMARDSVFLRADWQNAFIRRLSIASFVDTDLRDGSGLAQFSADYDISAQWTVGALANVYFGRRRSDFGSLPQHVSVLARISRFF